MTCSYNDNYFSSERLTFEKCHLQLMIISSYTEICSLHSKKTWRTVTNVCVFLMDAIIFLWFVYILPLEMTLEEGSGNVPLLESNW